MARAAFNLASVLVLSIVQLTSSAQESASPEGLQPPSRNGPVEPARAQDQRADAAVRAVVARYVAARERQDAAAIGALFTDDADQFNSAGEWRRGREAIVKGTLQSSSRNPGARNITLEAVRFPAPDVAIADGEYEIGAQRLWTTLVLTRHGETWRIAAIRNSSPRGN